MIQSSASSLIPIIIFGVTSLIAGLLALKLPEMMIGISELTEL